MGELIYSVFKYLSDVPVNFWLWLVPITAPILVFSAGPQASAKVRIGRLLLAIGLTYMLMNLSLHTDRAIRWKAYETCQSQFPDGFIQHHEECGEINIADGASNVFYLYLGWIPAAAYVGFWEIFWRKRHKKRIEELGKKYKGNWFSHIIFWMSLPVWVWFVFMIISLTYSIICHESFFNQTCF